MDYEIRVSAEMKIETRIKIVQCYNNNTNTIACCDCPIYIFVRYTFKAVFDKVF